MLIAALIVMAASGVAHAEIQTHPATKTEYSSYEALQRYLRGRLLEERGENADALTHYLRAMMLDFQAPAIPRRASEISSRMGEHERALEMAERSLRFDSENAEGLWLKGSALFNLRRPREALAALERSVLADSNRIQYLKTLARVAEHLDLMDRVGRAYTRVVELDRDDGEAWFQLAAARARQGRFTDAQEALGPAIELNPLRPGLYFLKGWVEEGLGNAQGARSLYREHLGIHPEDQTARRRLVNLLASDGQFEQAYVLAREVAKARPQDLEAVEVAAELAYRADRSSDGAALVERLKAEAGDDPRLIGRVVGVLIRADRVKEAFACVDDWVAEHPDDFRGPILAARARVWAGNPAHAIEHAQKAVAMAPDSLSPQVMLARLYQIQQRYQDAERLWLDVLNERPDDIGTVLDLAQCREKQGNIEGAEVAVRDIMHTVPENPVVLNFLGYLLADHNRKLDEAEELIRRAVNQEPDNGAFVDSMGWVYYRLGRLTEARRELERAVVLTGGDAVVHEHLGDVYKDLELLDLAKDQYEKSLARDGGNDRVRLKLVNLR